MVRYTVCAVTDSAAILSARATDKLQESPVLLVGRGSLYLRMIYSVHLSTISMDNNEMVTNFKIYFAIIFSSRLMLLIAFVNFFQLEQYYSSTKNNSIHEDA